MATRTSSRRSSGTRSRKSGTGTKSAGTSWDFSKEEGGGAGKRYREGDYLVQVVKVKPITSEDKGTPGLEVTFKFLDGKHKGETFTDRLWNTPKSLWRMRSLIEAVGEDVPAKAGDWKVIARLVLKKEVVVTLGDDEYDGRVRSRVTDFLDPEEFDDDADDDEDDDLDEDEDDDDLDDEDEDDEDDEDEDDDDDEEEEPAPKRRRRSSSKTKSTTTKRKRKAKDDEDDDLDDLDLDDL